MMSPEMMRMAQEMMSKMSPEQLAAMQRQAANMSPAMVAQAQALASTMSPDDLRRAQEATQHLSPEEIARQAAAAPAALSSTQKYQYDASMALKSEGNRLHSAGQYEQAAEKYARAVANLTGHASSQSADLRLSCQGNLASCHLQLSRWGECVDACSAVLAADSGNRKARYRRGQALSALGRHAEAVADLRKALDLSPDSEKEVVQAKLAEAEQRAQHAQRGVAIEEVAEAQDAEDEPPPLEEQDAPVAPVPVEERAAPASARAAPASAPAPAAAHLPIDPAQLASARAVVQENPAMMRMAADAMREMSEDEIVASLGAAGSLPAGLSPEMAKAAARMMKSMPPEDLQAMAASAVNSTSAGARPVVPVPPLAGAATASQMAAATEAMRSNPGMLKDMAKMMDSMPAEQLEAMMGSVPGAPPGFKMDVGQMKAAAKMMESMTPKDLERMTAMAQGMNPAEMGGGAPAAAGGAVAGPASAAPGMAGIGGMNPANMSPEMMAEMQKTMNNPETMKMMKNMMKSMPPEDLASMLSQTGMKVTPEQAKSLADHMDSLSDRQMLLITTVSAWIQRAAATYTAARAWARRQGALALAVAVLLLALLLRWLRWL